MIKKLNNFFEKIINIYYLVFSFGVFAILNYLILEQVAKFADLNKDTGKNELLEVPTFIGEDIYAYANQYTNSSIKLYKNTIQIYDIFYPVSAGVFFTTLIVILTKQIFPKESKFRLLPFLGVLMIITDWIENIAVRIILETLQNPVEIYATILKMAILVKFSVGILTVITSLTLILIYIFRKFIKKNKNI